MFNTLFYSKTHVVYMLSRAMKHDLRRAIVFKSSLTLRFTVETMFLFASVNTWIRFFHVAPLTAKLGRYRDSVEVRGMLQLQMAQQQQKTYRHRHCCWQPQPQRMGEGGRGALKGFQRRRCCSSWLQQLRA